jgi:MFS family permease
VHAQPAQASHHPHRHKHSEVFAPAPRRSWALLVLLCAAQFMVILDVTVVNVALPSIGADLKMAPADLQWVITAYVLVTGGLMLLGGRAADLLGRRPVFFAGLALFTAASLASGLAPSPGALIASRAFQGLGAALLVPAALSTVTTAYAGRQRTVALGVWGAIASAGAATGVLLGGILTAAIGWRAVFYINVPIGIAVAAGVALVASREAATDAVAAGQVVSPAAARADHVAPDVVAAPAGDAGPAMRPAPGGAAIVGVHAAPAGHASAGLHTGPTGHAPAPERPVVRRLDLPGAAAAVGGLGLLLFSLQGAADHGWGSLRTLGLFTAAVILLLVFGAIERGAPAPLVPPATWRVRSLVTAAATMLGATGILVGAFFLNTLYLQEVLGWGALKTGLAFLPLAVATLFGAHVASRALPRVGSRAIVAAGLALVAFACAALAAAPDHASYATDLLPAFVGLGVGVGAAFVAVSVAAMADVRHEQAGLAAGLMGTAHELGGAIGVALFSAVALGGGLATATPDVLAAGYGDGFTVAAAIAAAVAIGAVVLLPTVRPAPGARVGMH